MLFKIPRLYDSHTHFLATGEFASGLRLESLEAATDIAGLQIKPAHWRGEWLTGFGWDDKAWPSPPHKDVLDKVFPDRPVYFNKRDGHTSWLNSRALQLLGIQSESGVLSETEHLAAWDSLPGFTQSQMRLHILESCRVFNASGFTHVRDMSGTEGLWNIMAQLESSDELTLAVESNFTFYHLNELDNAIQLALMTKKQETALLRSKGVKFFFDGSLGSETAFLSKPYHNKSEGNAGKPLWSLSDVEEILKKSWDQKLEVAVHAIGDEASHQIVQAARKVSAAGYVGRLSLEHTQILRPETIQMMKPLHVRCHMQPCHWLSDRVWLKEKLGLLYKYAFPWEALRAAQIPVSFGCDSPIEPPSFMRNEQALRESAGEGIRKFTGDVVEFHSHPDASYVDSFTVIEDGIVKELNFNGKSLL
ncbi:Amidohydrolase family protein [compost metagenome]